MARPTRIFDELKALLPRSAVRQDEPLAKRTTLRVGGCADFCLEPASEEDLAAAIQFCRRENVPFLLLGRGSNLLVRDGGVRGVVISLSHPDLSRIDAEGSLLHCGAGARLKAASAKARELGLTGLEFMDGIPGSVGGALRMNAGAMGSSMLEVLTRVRFMDSAGKVHELDAAQVPGEYRSCPFFQENIVLRASFRGRPGDREAIAKRTAEFNAKRWSSQPREPSAGCIFKNPSPILSAGKLIEELGLKGTRCGGAVVSTVHGNFIINEGEATARDVLQLINIIQTRARKDRAVELRTEVEIIGEDIA
ncbi:MAG: UDP-N-acetylmuramate dehydrogenase [Verrucomicrobiota bacterium]|jgi:UDP-N-acetylenolpyruvoylglucosamine reductase